MNPTSGNIGSMPCVASMKVQFADKVPVPSEDATVRIGAALGKGNDKYGKSTPTDEQLMNQFETAGKLTSTTKKLGLGLFTDDGKG